MTWSVRCLACDTDLIRERARQDLGAYELSDLKVRDGVVTLLLALRGGEGRIGVALYAAGTRLFTSLSGRDADNESLANVGRVVAHWADDPVLQAALSECGGGFWATADPAPALQDAVDDALSGHGHALRRATSWWSIGVGALVGTLAVVILPARWRPRGIMALATAAVLLPIAYMIVQKIGDSWIPTSDYALLELRTRDVGTLDTPLVGPYSRYGWNHPGPLLFWLYAVPYRLAGGEFWGLFVAAGLVNLLAAGGTLWVAWRNGGFVLGAFVALGLALVIAGQNVDCVDPWNPFVPVLPFALLIASAWAVGEGSASAVILTVLVGSFVVQSHVGFALPVAVLWLCALVGARRIGYGRRIALAAAGALAACWAPILYDQFFGSGNLSSLWAYFTQDRRAIGGAAALGVWARELSIQGPWLGYPEPGDDVTGVIPVSAIHLIPALILFAGSAVAAGARGAWPPLRLQVVAGVAAAAGVVAVSRISEAPIWYLIRWSWVIAMWWWVSIGWSLVVSMTRRRGSVAISALLVSGALAAGISNVATTVLSGQSKSDQEAMLAIVPAAVSAAGSRGPVRVEAINPKATALGPALALQLEKRGIRLTVSEHDVVKFGRQRLAGYDEASVVFLVVAGGPIESLRQLALQSAPPQTEVRLIASFDKTPTRSVAVFGYVPNSPTLSPHA